MPNVRGAELRHEYKVFRSAARRLVLECQTDGWQHVFPEDAWGADLSELNDLARMHEQEKRPPVNASSEVFDC
jgi:hypothetical protein